MIYKDGQEITGVYFKPPVRPNYGPGSHPGIVYPSIVDVVAVYRGYQLVWSKFNDMLSCYSNGYWIDQYPWADNTYWVD